MAALKTKGAAKASTNFPISHYGELLDSLQDVTIEELIMAVRRQSQVRSTLPCGLHTQQGR